MPPRAVTADPQTWADLARWIRQRREALGMSQADLVAASGVSQSVLSKVENGRPDNGRLRYTSLRRLSEALGLPPDGLERMALEGITEPDLGGGGTSVEAAILLDPRLTDDQRQLLLAAYRGMVARTTSQGDQGHVAAGADGLA